MNIAQKVCLILLHLPHKDSLLSSGSFLQQWVGRFSVKKNTCGQHSFKEHIFVFFFPVRFVVKFFENVKMNAISKNQFEAKM